MTVGRRGREADRQRRETAAWTAVELEELPAQQVVGRGGRRHLGLRGAGATAAVALILAGGLGMFGGRLVPQPSAGVFVAPSQQVPQPTSAEEEVFPLAPASTCGPDPQGAPIVLLQEEAPGLVWPGTVELLDPGPRPDPSARTPLEPIDVRDDVTLDLWLGGACPAKWVVDASEGPATWVVTFGPFGDTDAIRFNLAGFGGSDIVLRAHLTFERLTAVASWSIRVLPAES